MALIGALIFSLSFHQGWSQVTTVSGKIIDAETGDPIPFCNIVFKGTTIGTSTDFEGFYNIRTQNATDSLLVSYVGYLPKSKPVKIGQNQVINFQLQSEVIGLEEVVVVAGENPAFPIMRNVIANKAKHDP